MVTLPPAPPSPVDAEGRPLFGTYTGAVGQVSWRGLAGAYARGPLYRRFHLKRWHYVGIATPRCMVAFAIIDLGYAASAFAYAFDREARRLLADRSWMGLPILAVKVASRAGGGARSRFQRGAIRLDLERPQGTAQWHARVDADGFTLDATLDATAAPPTLCAIAPLVGGVANCTHKTLSLPATGTLVVGERRFDLAGGFAALDHTAGLLARDTRWHWACGWGAGLGLNLVEGFNGAVENGLWLGPRLVPVAGAEIRRDPADPLRPWTVRTHDGLVDLTFTPEGLRREDKQLGLVSSHFVQAIGTFAGVVRGAAGEAEVVVRDLAGVTEDHAARW
jgi:hypothetical protein